MTDLIYLSIMVVEVKRTKEEGKEGTFIRETPLNDIISLKELNRDNCKPRSSKT